MTTFRLLPGFGALPINAADGGEKIDGTEK
jgi:hypothetical protein